MRNFSTLFIIFTLCYSTVSSQTAVFTVDDSSGCAPFTVAFTNNSTGADSVYWDFGDGFNDTAANPAHIYLGIGTFTVKLYVYDSLLNMDSSTQTISVSPLPYFTLSGNFCPGAYLDFDVINNYDPDNVAFWDFGDGFTSNQLYTEHAYSDTGVYTATLTVTNSACGTVIDSNQITITNSVIPIAHIHGPVTGTTICQGENFPLFYDEDLSILWNFGDGNSSTDPYPIYSYDSTGSFLVSITVTNECGNTNSVDTPLTVDTNVLAGAGIYSPKAVVCPNEEMTYSATPGSGYTYYWDFSDGDTISGQKVQHGFSDTGIYNIQLIVTNACGNKDTAYKTITVFDTLIPSGSINIINNKNVCPGAEVQIVGTNGFSSYIFNYGDGNTDTSVNRKTTHIYNTTGTYPVELTIMNECGSSASYYDTVVVDNSVLPAADFFLDQYSYCAGDIIYFNSNSGSDIKSHFWDFGDGNTDTIQNPTHSYSDTGKYDVTLAVSNYCGNTDTLIREINLDTNASAVSSFNVVTGYSVCPNTSLTFVNLSSDTSNCLWKFGDGDSSASAGPNHAFSTPGNYFVELTITNSCGKSSNSSQLVTVSGSTAPYADFSLINGNAVCIGEELKTENKSSDPSNSLWDFGDSDTSTLVNPTHAYSANGNYAVKLTVTNSCGKSNTSTKIITVTSSVEPNANYTLLNGNTICMGEAMKIDNISNDTINCLWDFGDGDTSALVNPTHTYSASGNYSVKLTVSNSCINSSISTQLITVLNNTKPIVNFSLVNGDTVCVGEEIKINNLSNDTTNSLWNFGDGDTSLLSSPIHIYTAPNSYSLSLIISNVCGVDTDSVIVVVSDSLAAPVASCVSDTNTLTFSWDSIAGAVGYQVKIDTGWIAPSGPGLSHIVTNSTQGDTVSLIVRAIDSGPCLYGRASEMASCSIINYIEKMLFNSKLLIYPNPGKGIYSLYFDSEKIQIHGIAVFNIIGERLKEINGADLKTNGYKIDLTSFSEGIYMLNINTQENFLIKKIILVK